MDRRRHSSRDVLLGPTGSSRTIEALLAIFQRARLSDRGLVFWAWLSTGWDDPIWLSARRIHPPYCSREIVLKIGLRQLRQAYIVPLDHICITGCKQDGNQAIRLASSVPVIFGMA
jgi:hypothetical protein